MSKRLSISDDLSLPIEFVTQTQAILARKRVGKSYTASVQAEEMLRLGQQVLVIDYTGAWWGLRAGRDGKPEGGHPIHVFGGDHGDVPLEERAGEVIAAAAVKERFSAILDMTSFRKGEALRFLATFFETLYRLNREPLHLFADEADAYTPQRTFAGEDARTLGAMNDIVLRGGIRGIGCTLITQRSARINKDVLSQCGVLTCLRTSSPQDLAAVKTWVDVHDEGKQSDEMMKSLPTLPIGTAWMWAPGWPTEDGIFKRIKVRQRETFDSGATPKPGQTIKSPKTLKPVDLVKLGETIKQTAEQAKANDPAVLRKRLADQEAELTKLRNAPAKVAATPAPKIVEKPVVTDKQVARLEKLQERTEVAIGKCLDGIAAKIGPLSELLQGQRAEILELRNKIKGTTTAPPATHTSTGQSAGARAVTTVTTSRHTTQPAAPAVQVRNVATGNPAWDAAARSSLLGPELRVLDAIAFWESIGVPQPVDAAVAFKAGYSPTSSAYERPRGSLRAKGLITFPEGNSDKRALTDAGRGAAVFPDGAATLKSLHEQFRKVLDRPQVKLMDALIEAYPDALSNERLAEAAGYSVTSSAYERPRGRLRTFGLAEFRDGGVAATRILFPDGLA